MLFCKVMPREGDPSVLLQLETQPEGPERRGALPASAVSEGDALHARDRGPEDESDEGGRAAERGLGFLSDVFP